MPVSEDRKYTKIYVCNLLDNVKGKKLGEVDSSNQFLRTVNTPKITGIAGDVIEQSVFGYERDSKQECDIEVDGHLTELKTTGVRVPKGDLNKVKGKEKDEYNVYLGAKEGISITGVTFDPTIQTDFLTSHFWEKSERLLIVFYEYKSYNVVPASGYADFPIVDYCFNSFSEEERDKLKNDWEIVRDYLQEKYSQHSDIEERNKSLVGFTHILRPSLLLIELVPGFKRRDSGAFQKPRYRLKQTFVDHIVRGHFDKSRVNVEVNLQQSFSSFAELDARCHMLTLRYKGKTIHQLKEELQIDSNVKDIAAKCVLKMFGANCKKLNQISDFSKVGIIAKTITITPKGNRTEDMKLKHIDFEEWADSGIDFVDSEVFCYFNEHSFLCPIFCEHDSNDVNKTTFEGFKRFAFDDEFINNEVKRTWENSRKLIFNKELEWINSNDIANNIRRNSNGAYIGAPNFPKSSEYIVFFRGGSTNSSEQSRTECVNNLRMLPQFFWLKGSYIAKKLKEISYL